MGEFLRLILDNLRELIPVKLIRTYERGVRFRAGIVEKKPLDPGPRFFWPFWWTIETVNIAPDILDIENLPVTTKDKRIMNMSAIVNYEVVDAVAAYCNVQSYRSAIRGVVVGHLCDRAADFDKDILLEQRADLKRTLRERLTTCVKDWGVRVNDVSLTHTVETKPFTLFNLYSQRSDFD